MIPTQIQVSEGSQTTKLIAPRDGRTGEIFTFHGVPVIAVGDMKARSEAVFFKRATIKIPLRTINLQDAAPGPLLANMRDIPDAVVAGWQEFDGFSETGSVEIGLVERIIHSQHPRNRRIILSLSDGHGGSGGGAGDEARFEAIETKNEDQDAGIDYLFQGTFDLQNRVRTLEGIVDGGGEGPDLSGIQDQIDDLDVMTSQLAFRASQLEARSQTMIFKVVQANPGNDGFLSSVTVAPGATIPLSFTRGPVEGNTFFNNGLADASPDIKADANSFSVNGFLVGRRIQLRATGVFTFVLQLAAKPDVTGDNAAPYYAGAAMSLSVRKFNSADVEQTDAHSTFNQVAGYWNGQRLEVSVIGVAGDSFQFDVGNTNTGAAGDDQNVVLGPGGVILASCQGRL